MMNNIKPEQIPDINQLILVAEYYIDLAKKILDDNNKWLIKTTLEIGKEYSQGIPSSQDIKSATLAVAHLASASSRICTIEETLGCKPEHKNCYNNLKNNLSEKMIQKYICVMLRDNYSHLIYPENINYIDPENTRRKILNDLTPKKIGLFVENYFKDFKIELNKLLK